MKHIRDRLTRVFRPVLIVRDFVRRHEVFIEYLIVGTVVGLIVSKIPFFGKVLGDLVLLAFVLAGMAADDRK